MMPIDPTIGKGEICPHCGFNNTTPEIKGSLPYRTLLRSRYIIGRVKSANSEGMTYAAFDTVDEVRVSIREFFPTTLAYRYDKTVSPAQEHTDEFEKYLRQFAALTHNLIRLDSADGIISACDIFTENGTAYGVFRHYDSVSLSSYIKKQGPLSLNTAKDLFLPLMSSLSAMHAAGVRHLGISPDTLRICRDKKLRLSEFSIEAARRTNSSLEPDLVPGCAAYEQYTKSLECGETTDIYGFTASLLFALTGELPADAVHRHQDPKLMISKDILRQLPENVISAIAGGLQVNQENRISSFQRLRAELEAHSVVTDTVEETNAIKELPKTNQYTPQTRLGLPPKVWLTISFVATAVVLIFGIKYLLTETDFNVKDIADSWESRLETNALEVIQVPDLKTKSYQDWQWELKDSTHYKFSIKVESQEFSEEIPEGRIISQNPAPGESLVKNGSISVVVSRGSTKRILPQINGKKFTDALKLLEDEGFEVIKEETYDNQALDGVVLWYVDYNSGDELDYGTKVKVMVSMGKDPSTIKKPNKPKRNTD